MPISAQPLPLPPALDTNSLKPMLAHSLKRNKDSDKKICALIKGDISGIQNFLYQIVSDGAANQLRGSLLLSPTAH